MTTDIQLVGTDGIPAGIRTAPDLHWPLLGSFLVLAAATVATLAQQVWSTEAGTHAPIVVATGLWLLRMGVDDMRARRSEPRWWVIVGAMLVALPLYSFGRAYDFISLETAGLYILFLAFSYRVFGDGMRAHLFPFLYLGFIVPPPGWVIDQLTAPLQTFVSYVATGTLQWVGYPIVRQGVTLYIAQYQLLVEDACAGMNSIVGLIAISLFYIYITHRASLRYSALLMLLIIPVAILSNMIRVMMLVLVTYYFGDAAAQGVFHETAGLMTFTLAVLLIFGLDGLIGLILRRTGTTL